MSIQRRIYYIYHMCLSHLVDYLSCWIIFTFRKIREKKPSKHSVNFHSIHSLPDSTPDHVTMCANIGHEHTGHPTRVSPATVRQFGSSRTRDRQESGIVEVVERQTLMRHYFNETILLDRAALNISVKAKCL